jgi:hypothetical protein
MKMDCLECGHKNKGKNFCSKCGWPLTTKDYIARKTKEQLDVLLSSRELIETESADRIFEKAWEKAKFYFSIIAIVLALLGAVFTWKIVDFNSTLEAVQQKISEETASYMHELDDSKEQLKEANQLQPDMEKLRNQMAETASAVQATQQVLSNQENLVKDIFSSHQYETFQFEKPGDGKYIILPAPAKSTETIVLFLLQSATIADTLRLQSNAFTQPPGSYSTFHNLVIFRWGDPIATLKTHPLITSYFPDKKDSDIIHSLTLRDGRAYADDEPLPTLNAPDPDFKGNKWGDVEFWKKYQSNE